MLRPRGGVYDAMQQVDAIHGDARDDDAGLIAAFESALLPAERWTHEAHVRVAFSLLAESGYEGALRRIRVGIRRLNESHGVRNDESSGYHETITVAFLRLIAEAALRSSCTDSRAFVAEQQTLADSRVILRHYSRARLLSPDARARFVEPDVAPLPGP